MTVLYGTVDREASDPHAVCVVVSPAGQSGLSVRSSSQLRSAAAAAAAR